MTMPVVATRSVRVLKNKIGASALLCHSLLCCNTVLDGVKLGKANRAAVPVLLHTGRNEARVLLEQMDELKLAQRRRKSTRKDCL